MIDKETEIYNHIKNALDEEFGAGKVFVLTSYLDEPSTFPCVYMEQTNSYTINQTNSDEELYAVITYQFDIYSNKTYGRKQECKQIAYVIDDMMHRCNFIRTTMVHNYNPSEGTVYTNDVHDENIYRFILRYEGIASKDYFYRR